MKALHAFSVLFPASATLCLAQSPPGFEPATSKHLSVRYDSFNISPAGITVPASGCSSAPILAHNGPSGPFIVIMMDLSLQIPGSAGNTTLLHWILPGLTTAANGSALTTTQNALAPYIAPAPPAKETHTYALLLYSQPSNFSIPADFIPYFNNLTASIYNRVGFNVSKFTTEVGLGSPIAADWFLVGDAASASDSAAVSHASASASIASPILASTAPSVKLKSILAAVALLSFTVSLL